MGTSVYISGIRVKNYKSFLDSDWISFDLGINAFCGQNHSGKTALLEVLGLKFSDNPHRSLHSLPDRNSELKDNSEVEVKITISYKGIAKFAKKHQSRLYFPTIPSTIGNKNYELNRLIGRVERVLRSYNDESTIDLVIPLRGGEIYSEVNDDLYRKIYRTFAFGAYEPSYPLMLASGNKPYIVWFEAKDNQALRLAGNTTVNFNELFVFKPFFALKSKIYRFYAERLNVGKCQFGTNVELKPNASNLAEVISCLSHQNPSRFARYNRLVSVVLPQIKWVSSVAVTGSKLEIRIWNNDIDTERNDLTVSLADSGSGVGQVLAMLYVIITSDEPRVIIIDEPQSYLNPGALRKLMEIVQSNSQHQYFISTHSPLLISMAQPATVNLVKYENCLSTTTTISREDRQEMKSMLDEVGLRLSDLYGVDNILWVEGPTEEECFPLILRKVAKIYLEGTQILAVQHTGDLEGKKGDIYFDIYDRISSGFALIPPAIGFVLDNENKSKGKVADLKRRAKDKLKLLKRCMYENYLLVPEAITAVLNSYKLSIQECSVRNWLEQEKLEWLKKEGKKRITKGKLTDEYWREKVHRLVC